MVAGLGVEIVDYLHGFGGAVGDGHQIRILRADVFTTLERAVGPLEQPAPVAAPKTDQWKPRHLARLHQCEDFKEFIHRAKPAGHVDKRRAVFGEAHFASEKVVEIHRDIGVRIAALFEGQFDIQAHGFPASLGRALVGGFHDAGAAAGDDGIIVFRQTPGEIDCGFVIFIAWLGACGAKHSDRRANVGHFIKTLHEFGHDAEYAPRILVDKTAGFFRGRLFSRHEARVGRRPFGSMPRC